jgi:poly(A) polymerase
MEKYCVSKVELPAWLDQRHLQLIAQALGGEHKVRLVGGCVRDILAGVVSTDVDLATPVTPEHVMQLLKSAGIRAIPTGIEHGTVTALLDGHHYEITTLRRDVAHDGRRAEVAFSEDWREDALRRDFTINAMSMDLRGKIYDYFEGTKDLPAQMIRFVGDPWQRIKEDYLRIFRYFRFFSYFKEPQLHQDSLRACLDLIPMSKQISAERITKELLLTLSRPYPQNSINLLTEYDLLPFYELPHLSGEAAKKLEKYQWAPALPLANLAAVIRASGLKGESAKNYILEFGNKRKLSNQQKYTLKHLCAPAEEFTIDAAQKIHRKQIYLMGKEVYISYLTLKNIEAPHPDFDDHVAYAEQFTIPQMPVTGEDVKAMGHQGKQIGIVLEKLEQAWITSDFTLTKEELHQLAAAKGE